MSDEKKPIGTWAKNGWAGSSSDSGDKMLDMFEKCVREAGPKPPFLTMTEEQLLALYPPLLCEICDRPIEIPQLSKLPGRILVAISQCVCGATYTFVPIGAGDLLEVSVGPTLPRWDPEI